MTELSGIAFIALGANFGAAEQNIHRAMERLAKLSEDKLLKSGLWLSEPLDCPAGSADFVNAVVGLKPGRQSSPEGLLQQLNNLELEFGRPSDHASNSPRPLDLDIITYGDLIINLQHLVIPHPRAHQRSFVLKPLQEIAPQLVLPGFTETVTELAAKAAPLRIERLS